MPGSSIRASASIAANARKKSRDSTMSRSGCTAAAASQPAQRLDGVEPHVGIGIAERLEERRHRRGVLLIAEREGGLDAQVGVAVLQQRRPPGR